MKRMRWSAFLVALVAIGCGDALSDTGGGATAAAAVPRLRVIVVESGGGPLPGAVVDGIQLIEGSVGFGYCANGLIESLTAVRVDEAGRCSMPLPERTFHLTVEAPSFHAAEFGPFHPAEVCDRLVLTVERGPALRGRVIFAGRPIPDAIVDVWHSAAKSALRSTDVAPFWHPFDVERLMRIRSSRVIEPSDVVVAPVRTDHLGEFVVDLSDAPYAVSVEADGFPMALRGPFDRTPEVEDLVIELSRGGSIAGTVFLPPGEALQGRHVGVANGWNVAKLAKVDAAGAFRIDELEPGSYQVRLCDPLVPEASLVQVKTSRRGTGGAIEWDCEVRDGQTTWYDVDAAKASTHVLDGRLISSIDGLGLRYARILDGDANQLDRTELDHNGRFRLVASTGGFVRLRLLTGLRMFSEVSYEERIWLNPGVNTWSRSLELGTLIVRGTPPRTSAGGFHTLLRLRIVVGDAETRVRVPIDDLRPGNELRVSVPSGHVRLAVGFGNSETILTWAEVRPGRETVVKLP